MSSMIPLAKTTVQLVAITIFTWKLFCFEGFWKVETDGQTEVPTEDICEKSDHYQLWLWVGHVDQNVIVLSYSV